MLIDIEIRPAVEADGATIRSMVREARLVPTNLHWSRFLVAEEGELIVGIQQVKVHKGGTREVASRAVRPQFRRRGIGTELMRAALARKSGPLYLRCNEKWARYYERFGFRRVEPTGLPADFRRLPGRDDHRGDTVPLRPAQAALHPHETGRVPGPARKRRHGGAGTEEIDVFWMNDYLMVVYEVKKASRARQGHRKGEPSPNAIPPTATGKCTRQRTRRR